jgi:hypothetical protein
MFVSRRHENKVIFIWSHILRIVHQVLLWTVSSFSGNFMETFLELIRSSPAVLSMRQQPCTKLKLRQQKGGRLLIANHLDQSLWCARNTLSTSRTSQIIFIKLFTCCTFYNAPQTWAKTIFSSHTGIFFIQFSCAGSHPDHPLEILLDLAIKEQRA